VKMKTRKEIEASLKYSRELCAAAKAKLDATQYGTIPHRLAAVDHAIWLGRIEAYKDVLRITGEEE